MQANAPAMTPEDLETLCEAMLKMYSVRMTNNRALVLLHYHSMCRISASSAFRCSRLSFNGFVRTIAGRSNIGNKNRRCQEVLIFMHVNNWKVCPLHALGEYFVVFVCFLLSLLQNSCNVPSQYSGRRPAIIYEREH